MVHNILRLILKKSILNADAGHAVPNLKQSRRLSSLNIRNSSLSYRSAVEVSPASYCLQVFRLLDWFDFPCERRVEVLWKAKPLNKYFRRSNPSPNSASLVQTASLQPSSVNISLAVDMMKQIYKNSQKHRLYFSSMCRTAPIGRMISTNSHIRKCRRIQPCSFMTIGEEV